MRSPVLALLLLVCAASLTHAAWPAARPLDEDRLAAAGLRVVASDHATLVTDAAPAEAVDALPRLVDLGLPQWGERFGVASDRLDGWRLRVYLVEDEARFRSLGLWPDKSPEFPHGLSLGHEVWLRQQATDHYRRHLLLHEATHSFMATLLGSCGPGWYMEGMAELCGTHAWDPVSGRLRLSVVPATRDAARGWGRIRLVREAVDAGRSLSVEAVRRIDNRVILATEQYAWVWALASFLDTHPAYRDRFGKASAWVTSDAFDRRFSRMYARDRRRLDQEWRLFTNTLVYGHDLTREAIPFQDGAPLADGGSRRTQLKANQGWQPSGVAVQAGQTHHLKASGRFVIGREPDGTPWPCEANGVTLAYHDGRPVGQLLATVDAGAGAFVEPVTIGSEGDFTPPASGTLYLRVNDSPASLAENEGTLSVRVTR